MTAFRYKFSLLTNPDLVNDRYLSDDEDSIDELNSDLDWWDYLNETLLTIGRLAD